MPTIHTTGAVTVFDDTFFTQVPPEVVGSAPQWADDSDATYAELETFESPDVSTSDTAFALLDNKPVTTNEQLATVTARVRYSSLNDNMARPLVAITTEPSPTAEELLVNVDLADEPGRSDPTWVEVPLSIPPGMPSNMTTFLDRMNSGSVLYVRVHGPWLLNTTRSPRTRIYEVQVVVTGPTIAPPCRLYPADTHGSVGGAVRQYPPSKSRQRSSRGVGYY